MRLSAKLAFTRPKDIDLETAEGAEVLSPAYPVVLTYRFLDRIIPAPSGRAIEISAGCKRSQNLQDRLGFDDSQSRSVPVV